MIQLTVEVSKTLQFLSKDLHQFLHEPFAVSEKENFNFDVADLSENSPDFSRRAKLANNSQLADSLTITACVACVPLNACQLISNAYIGYHYS